MTPTPTLAPLPAQLALGGTRARRRLPGFRFEFQPPPPADVLPRMDIAALVGFAASGPLHTPVPVEDPRRFAEIFFASSADLSTGDLSGFSKPDRSSGAIELPLAWDAERGEWAYGQLGPAVRAFLRNGGRRCWVVRVADAAQAETARFLLPGVMQVDLPEGDPAVVQPAVAWARSPGSWADGLRVGAGLTTQGIMATDLSVDAVTGEVVLQSVSRLAAGDVLRLLYADDGIVGYVAAEAVSLVQIASSPPGAVAYAGRGPAVWFRAVKPEDLAGGATVAWWGANAEPLTRPALGPALNDGTLTFSLLADAGSPPAGSPGGAYPAAGSLVRQSAGETEIWLIVDSAQEDAAGTGEVTVSGRGLTRLPAAPPVGLPDRCERLRLELTASLGNLDPWRLGELDFAPASDRYWGGLPSDAALYDPDPDHGAPEAEVRERRAALWRAASAPRFPLAGSLDAGAPAGGARAGAPAGRRFSFPFVPLTGGFPVFGSQGETAALAQHSDRPALERDGLSRLSSELFLDPDLAGNLTADLLNHADDIRYISPYPRPLRGIHAVLAISEVTLVAVPDATQRPWERGELPALDKPPASPIPERSAWRPHICPPAEADQATACVPADDTKTAPATRKPEPLTKPAWGEFLACTLRVVQAPAWQDETTGGGSIIHLAWDPAAAAPFYTVEEATQPDFGDARRTYEGTEQAVTLYGRSAGTYYYRVRGQEKGNGPDGEPLGGNFSNWSERFPVRVGPPAGLVVKPMRRNNPTQPTPAEIEQRGLLLQVQRGLLRMCAARGDLFAVLALPQHYRENDAIDYVNLLGPSAQPVFNPDAVLLDLPLGFGETSVLSYAAVYHPWLIEQDASRGIVRRASPDGALCGLIAARALSRGAWVAPAGQELAAVVALTPPIARSRWLDLQEAQINVIRQEPDGFITLSADTLSHDPDLVQINVRRLMQLLRRTVERLGPGFVFEPQGDAFQRLVRRDVEAILRVLFDRGAFSGASPESSYRVTVRTTPQDLDAGRLIVEIRVAPSRPMEFLTVRLVQTGHRAVVTEE